MASVHAGEHGVEFVGDALLLAPAWERNLCCLEDALGDVLESRTAMRHINQLVKALIDRISEEALVDYSLVNINTEYVLIQQGFATSPDMSAK